MTRDELLEECFGRSDFPAPRQSFVMRDAVTNDVQSNVDIYLRRVKIRRPPPPPGTEVSETATTLTVLGIAQVCTDPAYRGRGYASALVRSAHNWARGLNRPLKFAALFGLIEFYGRLGYSHPEGAAHPDFLVCKLADEEWPAGRIDTMGDW